MNKIIKIGAIITSLIVIVFFLLILNKEEENLPENTTYNEKLYYVIKNHRDIDNKYTFNTRIDFSLDFNMLDYITSECSNNRNKYCKEYIVFTNPIKIVIEDIEGKEIVLSSLPDKKYKEEKDALRAGTNQIIEDIEVLYNSLIEE